jgi:hypothetical protein
VSSSLTNEEKRKLSNERQNAIRHAWKEEKERVKSGRGTRDWSISQQKEIIEREAVSGYKGHHMKSVSLYPSEAGNPKNIQFLTEDEHFNGAHQGSFHHATNGYYDPETKTMHEFESDEIVSVPVINLSETYTESSEDKLSQAKEQYIAQFENNDMSEQNTNDKSLNNDNSSLKKQISVSSSTKTESDDMGR